MVSKLPILWKQRTKAEDTAAQAAQAVGRKAVSRDEASKFIRRQQAWASKRERRQHAAQVMRASKL